MILALKMIKINRLTKEDIEAILPNIHHDDVTECELMAGRSIDEIIRDVEYTTESYAASINRRVIALFGVNIHSGQTLAWMVTTDELTAKKNWRPVASLARKYIKYFVRKYGTLTNFVWTQNHRVLRWLRFHGARLSDDIININGKNFKQFWLGG